MMIRWRCLGMLRPVRRPAFWAAMKFNIDNVNVQCSKSHESHERSLVNVSGKDIAHCICDKADFGPGESDSEYNDT